jgi:hypothetical protein
MTPGHFEVFGSLDKGKESGYSRGLFSMEATLTLPQQLQKKKEGKKR